MTATLDETYARLDRPGRFGAIRQYQFTIMPSDECSHDHSSVCATCAREWTDYEFGDDFPFERGPRITVRDLIEAGQIQVGTVLTNDSHSEASAVVTGDGGLMLTDGRIYSNPSAAAHAVRRMSSGPGGPDTCPD
ncbi:hypothetical protein [Nocardia terpenica]|uniref:RAMA domain-containing protein n=1 Tax=Nocardia terpenica TaxID=455432 RepID=A0A164JCD5_9NOCA|nr:hypothetical protein [Nocardia terpenica]KZM70265.1 hypothetical protein AWN90_06895 [Nocardia terpenica]NQE91707.1 hypothetical protein [Nocardia terpenica]